MASAAVSEKFNDALATVAEKVDDNKYLASLKNAFTLYLPFILVGSFATLLQSLISSDKSGLARWVPALKALDPAFAAMNFATMSFMTIPIVFLLAWQLAKRMHLPEYVTSCLAVVCYISVVPQTVTATVGQARGSAAGVGSTALGAQGLFIGILLTIAVVHLFKWLSGIRALKINMPPSVPPAIAGSFNALIPVFITLLATSVAGGLFKVATGSYINEWIYKIMQAPLEAVFQSPVGIIAIVLFSQLFWFLGIHGGLVISPIRNPLMASAIAANIAARAAGDTPNQPVTYGFWVTFIVVGGAGITISLILAILAASKQEDLRMVSKLAFLPGLCGISEPLVFGVPLVLNPIFAIPFILNSGIATAIALAATRVGFLTPNTVDVPFGTPIGIGAFISYGWRGPVVQLVIIAVCFFTWLPFVIANDRKVAREAERDAQAELEAERAAGAVKDDATATAAAK